MITAIKTFLRVMLGSVRDLTPILLVVLVFQSLILQQPFPQASQLIAGTVLVVLGLTFFIFGLEQGLFPIGESLAYDFARKGSAAWLFVFAFALGFGTTIAEQALIAVAEEAAAIAAVGGVIDQTASAIGSYALGLRLTVAVSVGIAIVVGVLRILKGWPIHWIIVAGYIAVVIMTWFAPREIIGIAYDSGGVTTSTITVPLVTALGIGLAEAVPGRNPLIDGFGLIAFASLFPIMSVMAYAGLSAAWSRQHGASHTAPER